MCLKVATAFEKYNNELKVQAACYANARQKI